MDKLDTLFAMQKQLDEEIREKHALTGISNEEWVRNKAMALMLELSEVVAETNYRWWKQPKPIDEAALKEELVDVLHFFLGMCIDAGMDAQELFDVYLAKNEENHKRQNGTSQKQGY